VKREQLDSGRRGAELETAAQVSPWFVAKV